MLFYDKKGEKTIKTNKNLEKIKQKVNRLF